jgi:Dolichyl-phosphate-mannose-protein mannosyltransferase
LLPPTNDPGTEVEPAEPEVHLLLTPQARKIAPSEWISRLEWLAVLVTALVAVALHLRFVTCVGGLWRDETNSVHLATLPSFAELLSFLDYDSFPILFFAVLRGWLGVFGSDSDVALRALGCIVGLAVLGALWFNARAFGIRWPVLSLALVGLNPMIIRYGDSTRAYGLGILLILLTFHAFWRLVDRPSPPEFRRLLIAAGLAVLSVQCLYYNSILLLAIAAGAIAVALRRRAWRTVGIVLGIGILAAVSLLPYLAMMRRMRDWTFMVSYPADIPWLWKRICEVLGSPDPLGIWLWLGLFLAGVTIVGSFAVSRSWRWFARRGDFEQNSGRRLSSSAVPLNNDQPDSLPNAVLFAAVALVVGVVGYAVFLRTLRYYTQPWYYITLVAFAACALEVIFGAWPIGAGRRILPLFLRSGRLVAGFALLSFTGLLDWQEMSVRHTNVDLLAAQLRPLATNGDVILVPRWECAIPLARYYPGPAEIITLPPIDDHRFHRYDLVLRQMMTADPIHPVLARMEEVLRSGHRVFLAGKLSVPDNDSPPPSLPPAYRDAGGTWHVGDYLGVWQSQAGQFLRAHATRAQRIEVPIPGQAHVQDFESLELGVVAGWR